MGFVLDIILAAVILISLFLGLKQGIVRTAVGFVGGIFALAASAVDTGLLRKPFGLFLLWSGGTMLLGAFRRPDSGQTEE